MFDFARLLQLCVELLAVVVAMVLALVREVTPRGLEEVTAVLGQDNGDVPMAIQPLGSDERLLTQVTQVTRTRIGGPVIVVPEVACRDHSKGAHSGQRSAFRAPQAVLAVSGIVYDFAVRSARELKVPGEYVARIEALVTI